MDPNAQWASIGHLKRLFTRCGDKQRSNGGEIACSVKPDPVLHLNVAVGKLSVAKSFHQHTAAKTRFYWHYRLAGYFPWEKSFATYHKYS